MRKLFALSVILFMTGCACSRRSKVDLYRTALADTNVSLTQCRDENAEIHKVMERQHAQLVAIKKQRRQLGK